MNLTGHFWTTGVRVRDSFLPPKAPDGRPWATTLMDPRWGGVRLTGLLDEPEGARALVLLVHGMGGSSGSPYTARAAAACRAAGFASLRLNLRGADGSGEDLYHAGIVEDAAAALASAEVSRYGTVFLWGYSLGGHLTLRYAALGPDPRVRGVVSVCAPLDLAEGVEVLDGPGCALYRRYLLSSLKREYAKTALRRPLTTPVPVVRRAATIRRFDDLAVAPRHGFADAADYYAQVSVRRHLERITVPCLAVFSERDPMVPPHTLRRSLSGAPRAMDVRWTPRGGHVAFPSDLDLGLGGGPGLEPQVASWLRGRLDA